MIDTTVFQNKTAVYYTLGCKLNFSETSTIGKILREAGVRTARKGEHADICVVNTCSVTEMADKKCRQAIHRLVKQHPGAFVVVTGCYAQLKPGDVAKIEGVDVVLGAEQKKDLLQYLGDLQKHGEGEAYTTATKDIRSFAPSCSRGDRTRFFLKVPMTAIIFVLIVPFLLLVGVAETERLLRWWSKLVRLLPKAVRRLCLPV